MFDLVNYEKFIIDVTEPPRINTCLLCNNRTKKPAVITNGDAKYNEDKAKEFGVWPIFVGHAGGSILLFPEDIGFTWIINKSILPDILKDILEYLKKFNDKIVLEGNDVMLDDKKLFGTMTLGEGPYYEGMFFSFNINLEVIKQVCLKPMKKEPYGLSNLGITPEDIEKLIKDLCTKYKLEIYGGEN